MSGKAKWGVIAIVVAVAVGIVWAAATLYRGQQSGEADTSAISDQQELTDNAGGDEPEQNEAEAASRAGSEDQQTDSELQKEAESYVSELAEPSGEPVPMDQAETFVGGDRPLSAETDGDATEGVTRREEGTSAETDASRETEAERAATGEEETSEGEATEMAIAAMQPQEPPQTPDGAEAEAASPPPPETAEPVTETSPSADAAAGQGDDGQPETGTAAKEATPQQPKIDLPLTEESPVTIAELLGPEEDIPPDAVYYVHTVQPDNDQGIWGIVHNGILKNFAEGVAVHRGEETETYQVDIPRHADEREPDNSSSFLGRLIFEKSRQSYVYNFETDRIGRDRDLIIPGQEIVIVSFTPEELIAVYKHFARLEGSNS